MKHVMHRMHSNGYVLIRCPNHPFANKDGFVPEHRLVKEKEIGRHIDPKMYHVHHIDGNKANNSISNLQLLDVRDHIRIHQGWKLINGKWWKTCSKCHRFLALEDHFYRRHTNVSEFVAHCRECCVEKSRSARNEKMAKLGVKG